MTCSAFWCDQAWRGSLAGVVESGVVIDVDDGVIAAVEVAVATPPPGATVLRGFTIPGLANAHSHAFQRALRGRTEGSGENRTTFWEWRDQMYARAAVIDPDGMHRLARATFAEMVLAGITVVGEFHYLHNHADGTRYDDPNEMGAAILAAADEAGIRITLLDTCYLHGGLDSGRYRPLSKVQRRFTDDDAEQWATRVSAVGCGPQSRVGAAIHSVRAVDPESIEQIALWADHHDAPLHAHVSEQPLENEQCLAAHGVSPTGLLHRHGALGDRFTAVHGTHLSDSDVMLLGEGSATVCLCPTTERDLADGIGGARAMVVSGVGLALGSDSQSVIDPFEEARAVELDQRLASGQRGHHSPAALLGAATAGGYRSLGWPGGGRLVAGAPADFTTLALDSPRMAGLRSCDLLAGAVYAATAADVSTVVVGGAIVVAEGHHDRIDVAAELREVLT